MCSSDLRPVESDKNSVHQIQSEQSGLVSDQGQVVSPLESQVLPPAGRGAGFGHGAPLSVGFSALVYNMFSFKFVKLFVGLFVSEGREGIK